MPKAFTEHEFIEKAIAFHGTKYDYSKVIYRGTKKKVTIICPVHGDFDQKPELHLKGGCSKCGHDQRPHRASNTKNFIEKALKYEIHEGLDYSNVIYIDVRTLVKITCHKKDLNNNEHGEFQQTPNKHLRPESCPKCGIDRMKQKQRKPFEQFEKECIDLKGEGRYDLSGAKEHYINSTEPINIRCIKHDHIFPMIPNNFITNDQNCPKCGQEARIKSQTHTHEAIVRIMCSVHNNKFDYSKFIYNGYNEKSIIICPIHGEIEQKVADHIRSHGCPKCGENIRADFHRHKPEYFFELCRKKHNNLYEYDGEYISVNKPINIKCKDHGWFEQRASAHLWQGNGCPICSMWKSEKLTFDTVVEITGWNWKKVRPAWLKGLELDMYCEDKKVAIEYDGKQHAEFISHFHKTEEQFNKQVERDLRKNQLCDEFGIKLIRVPHKFNYNTPNELQEYLIHEIQKACNVLIIVSK